MTLDEAWKEAEDVAESPPKVFGRCHTCGHPVAWLEDEDGTPREVCPVESEPDPEEVAAAWFALGRDFTYTGPYDAMEAHAIVGKHRPVIEAALSGSGSTESSGA